MALPGHMRHGVAGSTEFLSAKTGSTMTLYWTEHAGPRGHTSLWLYEDDTGRERKIQNIAGPSSDAEARADVVIAKGRL